MINVLSLFDGMSCGQIALKELGMPVRKYYASEIDKHAIKQTQLNFQDTIQLGDVTKVQAKDLDRIDLLIGGSPCQGFSFAGKQLNFNDPRSALFFEFVRLWKEIKLFNPNAKFLLENVNMKKEHLRVISEYLGVYPVRINSNLVSAQNRDRWYWTNIRTKDVGLFDELWSDIPQPEDKGILLKDILEDEVAEKYYLSDKMLNYFNGNSKKMKDAGNGFSFSPTIGDKKAKSVTTKCGSRMDDEYIICCAMRCRGENNEQTLEPQLSGTTNTLTSVQKDNLVMQLKQINDRVDGVSFNEEGMRPYRNDAKKSGIQELGTIGMENTKSSCVTSVHSPKILIPEASTKGYIEVGDGECFDLDNPNSKTRRGRKMEDKSNCLMAKRTDFMRNVGGRIRRLTPTECARLQTIPDWYRWECSDTQQYKMLGNGWNIETVAHILKFINKDK